MATRLIPSSFRLQIKEDTLWNDVGALCKCRVITIGNHVIGCGFMEDTGYYTSPIVSNESPMFGLVVILGGFNNVDFHLILHDLEGRP